MPDNQTAKSLDDLITAYRDATVYGSDEDRTAVRVAILTFHQEAIEREREKHHSEIIQLRGLALELSQALAKRCLVDANAEVADSREWPDGQEWDDLNGTSQSIMRRRGWAEAGLDADRIIALMCDQYGSYKEYDVEPLRSTTPLPEGEKP